MRTGGNGGGFRGAVSSLVGGKKGRGTAVIISPCSPSIELQIPKCFWCQVSHVALSNFITILSLLILTYLQMIVSVHQTKTKKKRSLELNQA